MLKPIQFKNSDGITLRGFVHKPLWYDTAVIYVHGFPSHCQSHSSKRLCRMLRWCGYLVLRFDVSNTASSEGNFENKLMSKEAEDIKYAIDFLEKNYKYKQLVLLGVSTGAVEACLYAYKDKRINKVILLGGESDLKEAVHYDFSDEQIKSFQKKGFIIYHAPEKWYHGKKLNKAFYDEFFTLDIQKAVKKYKKSILIIHGSKDEAVPVSNAHALYAMANEPKKLVIIKGADHRFSKIWHGLQVLWHIKKFIEEK